MSYFIGSWAASLSLSNLVYLVQLKSFFVFGNTATIDCSKNDVGIFKIDIVQKALPVVRALYCFLNHVPIGKSFFMNILPLGPLFAIMVSLILKLQTQKAQFLHILTRAQYSTYCTALY